MTFGKNWHFELEQGSDEWLAYRAGKVTASMVNDILAEGSGKSRENAKATLVCELLTGRPSENGFKSAAMIRGNELEPLARVALEAFLGTEIQTVGFVDHPTIEGYGASPDGFFELMGGFVIDDSDVPSVGDRVGVELKARSNAIHIDILKGKPIPKADLDQMIAQMDCCGFAAVKYGSFNPSFPASMQLVVKTVYRDEAEILRRRAIIKAFIEEAHAEAAKLRGMFP